MNRSFCDSNCAPVPTKPWTNSTPFWSNEGWAWALGAASSSPATAQTDATHFTIEALFVPLRDRTFPSGQLQRHDAR
jgi:hypothetical protein